MPIECTPERRFKFPIETAVALSFQVMPELGQNGVIESEHLLWIANRKIEMMNNATHSVFTPPRSCAWERAFGTPPSIDVGAPPGTPDRASFKL
jgi:hypothetical protein